MLLSGSGITLAQEAVPPDKLTIERVIVGIDGHYRVGRWTPISVTFEGEFSSPVELNVWVPDADGHLTKQPSELLTFAGSGPHTIESVFRTGRMDGVIRVELVSDSKVVASHLIQALAETDSEKVVIHPPHTLHSEFWVLLGPSSGFEQAAENLNLRDASPRNRDQPPVTVIPLASPDSIPKVRDGLDAVDVVTVTGPQKLDESTDLALRRWVELGGHLVISIGEEQDWAASPLSSWVPIRVLGDYDVNDLSGLTARLTRPDRFRSGRYQALRIEYPSGETLADSRDGPLWVRLPYQFGRVTFLGMNLSERPFLGWDTLPQLAELLVDHQRSGSRNRRETGVAQLSRTGVSDLSTQLAVAVDQFPQSETQSNWTTMGLVILYLLIIGPIDYLIVHYILRRPQLTWVTFPLIVIATAYFATSSARGSHATRMTSNQVNLMDLDVGSGMKRTTVWSSFVSPESKRYSLEAEFIPAATQDEKSPDEFSSTPATRLGWLGIPENGYRGMYRSGGLAFAKPRYAFAPGLTSIENVPVNIWSSSSVMATQIDRITSPTELIESHLEDRGGQLEGEVTNHLPVPIEDWFIAHQNLVYYSKPRSAAEADKTFESGGTLRISRERYSPNVLRNYLTGVSSVTRKVDGEKFDKVAAARDTYDPLSRDLYRLFRSVTFYRSSGGEEFTSLRNDQLEHYDLSPLLPLDRAVLFGRVSLPAASVIVDGQPLRPNESETFIRIVLPVESSR
ncbi:MAG: hypothetical protein R3B91_09260 [Planctomycetaceae bacterium]